VPHAAGCAAAASGRRNPRRKAAPADGAGDLAAAQERQLPDAALPRRRSEKRKPERGRPIEPVADTIRIGPISDKILRR
jgi:hypothetical protein